MCIVLAVFRVRLHAHNTYDSGSLTKILRIVKLYIHRIVRLTYV